MTQLGWGGEGGEGGCSSFAEGRLKQALCDDTQHNGNANKGTVLANFFLLNIIYN